MTMAMDQAGGAFDGEPVTAVEDAARVLGSVRSEIGKRVIGKKRWSNNR